MIRFRILSDIGILKLIRILIFYFQYSCQKKVVIIPTYGNKTLKTDTRSI